MTDLVLEDINIIEELNEIDFNQETIDEFNKIKNDIKESKNNIINLKKTEFFNTIFSRSPRLIFETFAVLSMVLIIIFFSKSENKMIEILPLLSLLGVSAIRLIPSFNSLTLGFTVIKKSEVSFEFISKYMNSARELKQITFEEYSKNRNVTSIKEIELQNINFTYPENNRPTLKNINFKIKKNSSIGIIGKTGCGKSTLVKLILGLLKPSSGKILFNKTDVHKNLRSWYDNISYIPQNIFLADDTIKNNIAFGVENSKIDIGRIKYAIKLAGLDSFINNIPSGVETRVGDGGFKISGGQIQRIGIARAIYVESNIFILDESTSSLDHKTEKEILNDFNKLKNEKFLIMVSHRMNSLLNCDEVFYIQDGEIKDIGKIEELVKRNPELNN